MKFRGGRENKFMRKYPGYFITFEGGEGSGKTTQLRRLVPALTQEGLRVLSTREPGGTPISEQIRDVIHDLRNVEMRPRAETLLYQAARAQIVEQLLVPKLKEGWIVVSDRYSDSTHAYQGYGHGQDWGLIKPLVDFATGGLVPDLTIFMDVDVETGLRRRRGSDEVNRMDSLGFEFYQRVRSGYLEMAAAEPSRWVTIDANRGIDEIYLDLKREIDNNLIFNGFKERPSIGRER